jgi:PAS domain S-box-containing protein
VSALPIYRAPLIVLVCTLVAAVGLAAYVRYEERLRLQDHVDGIAVYTSHWMEDRIAADLNALDRVARRWVRAGGNDWANWAHDASENIADIPEIRAMEWADTDFRIRRVIPMEGNEAARGIDLIEVLAEGDRLVEAARAGELFTTNALELVQGGTGFVAYRPLYVGGEFRGLMIAVFDVNRLVDLLAETDFGRETVISFGQNGTVYGVTSGEAVEQFSSEATAILAGREWVVTIHAKPVLLTDFLTWGPALTLLAGLVLGLALSGAVYGSQRARRKQRDSELAQLVLSEELSSANQRFEAAANGASVGIWDWLDVTKDEIWWSPVLFHLLGYDPDEVEVTQNFFIENVHPDDAANFIDNIADHFTKDTPFRVEYRLRHKSGEYRWFLGSGAAIRDAEGAPVRMVGSIMDIHELKQTQANLERANSAKTDFLANMSHEIRTPMNGILGMTSLMLSSDIPEDFRSSVEIIKASGDAMMDIVNDILDISKIEAGRITIEYERVDLEQVMHKCASLYRAQAEAKGVAIVLERLDKWQAAHVLGDAVRLSQVLGNLVSNAVKFTPKGEIRIAVDQERVAGGNVRTRFEVVDTGVGVPEQKMAEIFEPFTQADTSTTREFGGTGLGLAIARNLATMMGGDIGATSTPGEGSTFWFTVVNEPAEPADQTKDMRRTASQ